MSKEIGNCGFYDEAKQMPCGEDECCCKPTVDPKNALGAVERLADKAKDEVSGLFRKRYRQLNDDELKLHDEIKDKADELHALFQRIDKTAVGAGRNVAIAVHHLEDAVYRAVKGLTS